MSTLIFLGVLFVLVLVHELGHFAVAKWTGMRVDEFGIGFPPKLFGIKKGETEYTFNLLPIGGFVKIFGEDATNDSGEQLREKSGSFTSKSKWAQSAVLVAGVTMNILFAWLLVCIAFGMGVQSAVTEDQATENAKLVITHVAEESPAGNADLPSGAIVQGVQARGENLESLTPSAFTEFIAEHATEEHTIAYTYNGELRALTLTPQVGIIASDPSQPALGVALAQVDILERSVLESIRDASFYVISGLTEITVGIVSLIKDAVTLQADFSQVAGPIGIVGLVGDASEQGFVTLLMFTAFISLNLAVINILPFPALDGGRLLLVGIEALKGSPINVRYVTMLNAVGFLLLMLLMIAVTWNDIARLM